MDNISTDSFGNPLPPMPWVETPGRIYANPQESHEETMKEMALVSFLYAVESHIRAGEKVLYDANTKTAQVSYNGVLSDTLKHF